MSEHATASALSADIVWSLGKSENAVLLLDADGRLLHANPAARALAGSVRPGEDPAGLLRLMPASGWSEVRERGRWSGEVAAPTGQVLEFVIQSGAAEGVPRSMVNVRDVSARNAREVELQLRHDELQDAYERLAGTRQQLLQSEKMASIGQLAAGVAHEINNPIGYVHSNLGTLQEYATALLALLECHEAVLQSDDPRTRRGDLQEQRERLDVDFIIGDLPKLLEESREGIERVTKIVQDLKDFSRSSGSDEPMRPSDLHKGLESTINIVWNELKYKVHLEKHYGDLPLVECHASEINQVLMTLLINAGQAIENRGTVTIASGCENAEAWISIADNGVGIPPDVLPRIFDPFFTTKPIGGGTGLGLAVAYNIVQKHHGRIEVSSQPGSGSVFRLVLPVSQPRGRASD